MIAHTRMCRYMFFCFNAENHGRCVLKSVSQALREGGVCLQEVRQSSQGEIETMRGKVVQCHLLGSISDLYFKVGCSYRDGLVVGERGAWEEPDK